MSCYQNKYSVILDHNIDDLYGVLKNIDNYHKILPYIKKISYTGPSSFNSSILKAKVELEHFLIKLHYFCNIDFNDAEFSVQIDGYGGSFDKINAKWTLEKLGENKTKISYFIDFQLKSKLQQKIAAKIFDFYGDRLRDKLKNYLDIHLKKIK